LDIAGMMLKQAAKEAAVIILAAIVIGAAVYAVRPDKIGPRPTADAVGEAGEAVGEEGVSIISLDEAHRLHQEKKALFVDARHGVDYDAGHIKDAVNLVLADSEIWLANFIDDRDPQTLIITYCDGEHCHLAPELAEFLFFNGFDHVFYLENGWSRWRDSGYPVE
jgi:rhodanese-related sulfurtransferase